MYGDGGLRVGRRGIGVAGGNRRWEVVELKVSGSEMVLNGVMRKG